MNYELAKKLKDAGFPFKRIEDGQCCILNGRTGYVDFNPALESDYVQSGNIKVRPQHFFEPTLEELIEACGEDFSDLQRKIDIQVDSSERPIYWVATRSFSLPEGADWREYVFEGTTPQEAVANLWLELNKK